MVSFKTAIKNFYLKAFNFKNRATRAEFWWFQLFYYLMTVLLIYIGTINDVLMGLYIAFVLINVIPMLSLQVRRLHDIGHSAWSLLLCCIPYVGGLYALILFALPGEKHANKYGEYLYGIEAEVVDAENVNL